MQATIILKNFTYNAIVLAHNALFNEPLLHVFMIIKCHCLQLYHKKDVIVYNCTGAGQKFQYNPLKNAFADL